MHAVAISTLLLAAAPLQLLGQQCPGVRPTDGYRVGVRAEVATADSAWLTDVARSVAYRWRVPSNRRNRYDGWERVRQRLLPPEPRWADDWSPQEKHRAELRLTIFRDSTKTRTELTASSGDRLFDRSIGTIVDAPMPGSPLIPALWPGVAADSMIVVVTFGDTSSTAPRGVIHFAAVQTRGELIPNTLRVYPPAGHSGAFPPTTVKYDILETGRVDPASLEFVRSAGVQFDDAIRQGLRAARFRAPTSNCRPVPQTVVQTFGR
jgi:hypothetical protein